ncbi:MAG: GNAT family N-acetyltransferase [Candidatus Omnitrophota bacterium]|nr:GNAT family N-acetyltransferase [Candidatus Omnitrophota bacterium]MDZ4242222.1 GNAT family N-acetyltransferase [Candidatus Omnitrophota bacterium]
MRPFRPDDAFRLSQLLNDKIFAENTCRIPYPYEEHTARVWIATQQEAFLQGDELSLAVALKNGGPLIGATGVMHFNDPVKVPELGFWIGREYWGRGYCTEAAQALLDYVFSAYPVTEIQAHHFVHNAASGRVMRKLGMAYLGRFQRFIEGHLNRDAQIEVYSIRRAAG